MTPTLSQAPRIVDLADRILDDIRRKKLRPGEPYLSTADIARLLRVSGTAANRALQLLAQRQVLERRQRRGTFIAAPPTAGNGASLRRVHLVVHQDYLRTEGLLADGVVLGIQGELPGAEIQFNFLPDSNQADYVQRLVEDALRAPRLAGFVLVRSSMFTQRLLAASGLPTVVNGTLQPSIEGLAFVDRDHRQIGRLMAEYMLQRKCRRVALLLREHVGAGDHILLDTLSKEMARRDLTTDDLVVRCLPADEEAAQAAVAALIGAGATSLGLVCRSQPLARGAASAVAKLPRAVRRRFPIGLCDMYRPDGSKSIFPCIVPLLGPEEFGREIGRLLAQQARGDVTQAMQRVVPVKLEIPDREPIAAGPAKMSKAE
jgi:DNA-binding LacI/PurR family transcriptional regulator/DNA-binding transcriptional regulator YhcF (GntR family)